MKAGVDYIGVTTPFYCHDGQGNFVLHKRSATCRDEQGAWDMGGGQLHFGEQPEEGALREVGEEYGCAGEIEARLPAHTVLREHEGVKTHWLAVPFIVRVNRAEVALSDPEYMDELAWFRLDSLPDPLHTGLQRALQRFPEYFEKYR